MRVTPLMIALMVFALVCLVLLAFGQILFVGLALVVGAFALVAAREMEFFDRLSEPGSDERQPKLPFRTDQSIGLSDELIDLLKSAIEVADRQIDAKGRLEPFVLYDADSGVRMRRVPDGPPAEALKRAREQARAVHPDVPRVVLVVQGVTELEGRRQAALTYEAAERGHSARALVFVQPYERGRLVVKGGLKGRPVYLGESDYGLRLL